MIIYGEREALRDDIVSFVENVREGSAEAEMDITAAQDPIGVHAASLIDALLNRAPGEMTHMMTEWLHERTIT
jgi:hypothetical protein